ncbi:hypothetical protein [Croceibacterium atlanticum]|nr:hypothetical protein [Croceibacterium atlanticum]
MGAIPDPVGWWVSLGRPLRALPRAAALFVLIGTALLLVYGASSVGSLYQELAEQRGQKSAEQDFFGDVDLYETINRRMAGGEGYYEAALAEHRAHDYPARPFVTVRLPTLAWTNQLWGASGWRILAPALLGAIIFSFIGALSGLTLAVERAGAALLLAAAGMGVFYDRAGFMHELVAGLLLSLSLGLYRPHRWWPSLLAAGAALAVRELALPFILLWAAFAASQRRWAELAALAGLFLLFAAGMALHAWNVAEMRLPGDAATPGWAGMLGLPYLLTSIGQLTLLLALPPALAGPLALLPILGWIALGGRLGFFASLWFIGFGMAVALFARPNNFYWVLLLLPAYMAGLALVPRAVADLVAAITHPGKGTA